MEEYKITKCVPIETDFEIDFSINEAKIHTISEGGSDSSSKKENFLLIEVWTQLDDDVSEAAENVLLYARPSILIILSIISYLFDNPLTLYGVSGGEIWDMYEKLGDETGIASADKKPNEIKVSKFVHGHVDKSGEFLIILKAVYEKKESVNEFVVSLLSRWHKARYLEEQGEASLYYEESFLVYFHIIELCSKHYSSQQSKEAQDQIDRFTKELLSTTLKLRDNQLEQVSQEKRKAVRLILLPNGEISITSKICYFLDKVKLLDLKTQYFVEQVVKIRNTIAHSRPVNHKILNWPLPQFFSINGDVKDFICEMRTFTARMIGAYLLIESWIDKWADVHSYLDMPPEYIKKLISNNFFESITPTDFLKGTIDGVKPSSLVKHFLSNKMEFQELEIGLRSLMLNVEVDKESALEIFEAAIVLADSLDKGLSDRCRNIVVDIHEKKLVFYFTIKDVLRKIEQQGVKSTWFREWIKTGGHLN
jgi:hypothetical protein